MQYVKSADAVIPLRKRHTPPSEQTNEAPGLIETDQVEVEREMPADEVWPVEQSDPCERSESPLSED